MQSDLQHRHTNRKWANGFTLLELSIAIVIIALLIGGIVVGRDLIESSNVRSEASQLQTLTSAINTFKLKFNFVPGDATQAQDTAFGFFVWAGTNYTSSGNGSIQDGSDNNFLWAVGKETMRFFPALVQAKLMSGTRENYLNTSPGSVADYFLPSKINSKAFYMPTGNLLSNSTAELWVFMNGGNVYPGGNWIGSWTTNDGKFRAASAMALDNKLDDGIPSVGKMVVVKITGAPYWAADATANSCVLAGAQAYYGVSNNPVCQVAYRIE